MNKLAINYKDSLLNEIPDDWEVMTLNNILKIVRGFAFESGDYLDDGILNFRVTNVGHLANDIGSVEYLPNNFFDRFPSQQLKGGEIVIVMVGATTGKLGRVPSDICPALMNQNLWKLIAKDIIVTDFLWHLLPSIVNRHMQLSQGSARDFLKQSEFIKTLVAGPFKNQYEQAKIAEVLSTVDKAISETEALIAKQQRIKTGLMQDLLTRGIDENGNLRSEETHQFKDSPLGRIPVEWELKTLNDCVPINSPICYGILMPGQGYDNGVPVIKVKDIFGGQISQDDILLTDPKIDEQYRRSRLKTDDVLLTIRGTTGRVAMVPLDLEGANITQDTARIRIREDLSNYFFYFLLQFFYIQEQIKLHTLGQAVKGINIGEVKKIFFGLPNKSEQIKIVNHLRTIQKSLISLEAELLKLCRLKTALMQDLLTGKKRVTPLLKNSPIS